MKSTLIKIDNSKRIIYPCLMESTESGCVVLFTDNSIGTVISETKGYNIGFHSDGFMMSNFRPFNGSVTLEND